MANEFVIKNGLIVSGTSDVSGNLLVRNSVDISGSLAVGFNLDTGLNSVAIGNSTISSGSYSHAEGNRSVALGEGSHAEGQGTLASGNFAHAEGFNTTGSGNFSHAEGDSTAATAIVAHAEGLRTLASAFASHAEGSGSRASGYGSHAEGDSTSATGIVSHAEGVRTIASGYGSHAEGAFTSASAQYQHAEGIYNATRARGILLVGNGVSETQRTNLLEANLDNQVVISGSILMSAALGSPEISATNMFGTASWAMNAVNASSNIVSAYVGRGVDVTLGNLRVRMAATGNASLQLSTVTGAFAVYGSNVASFNSTIGGATIEPGTPRFLSPSPVYINPILNYIIAGSVDTWIITSTIFTGAWRINLIIGSGYNNNFISIEKLF